MRLFGVLILVGSLIVLPWDASAQTSPLPLPSDPGSGRPAYIQPPPTPATSSGHQPSPAPVATTTESPLTVPPTSAPPAPGTATTGVGPSDVSKAKTPQVTAFPELTRGVGNSEMLLQ